MRGIYWVGLTAVAAAGGIYMHSEEVQKTLENAEYAIGERNATFEEEMSALEDEIASGELERGQAIDLAIKRTIERATGADPGDPDDGASLSITLGGDGTGSASVAEAVTASQAQLDEVEAQIEALRDGGMISQEQYSDMLASIQVAEERIAELGGDGG